MVIFTLMSFLNSNYSNADQDSLCMRIRTTPNSNSFLSFRDEASNIFIERFTLKNSFITDSLTPTVYVIEDDYEQISSLLVLKLDM